MTKNINNLVQTLLFEQVRAILTGIKNKAFLEEIHSSIALFAADFSENGNSTRLECKEEHSVYSFMMQANITIEELTEDFNKDKELGLDINDMMMLYYSKILGALFITANLKMEKQLAAKPHLLEALQPLKIFYYSDQKPEEHMRMSNSVTTHITEYRQVKHADKSTPLQIATPKTLLDQAPQEHLHLGKNITSPASTSATQAGSALGISENSLLLAAEEGEKTMQQHLKGNVKGTAAQTKPPHDRNTPYSKII